MKTIPQHKSSSSKYPLAKEYLSSIRRLNGRVESCSLHLEFLRSLAAKVTSTLSSAPVSHSPNVTALEDSVIRIMEAEELQKQEINALLQASLDVQEVLSRIQDVNCRLVLEMHYISLKTFPEIADHLRCSRRWVVELHSKGLRIVQRILEDREAG